VRGRRGKENSSRPLKNISKGEVIPETGEDLTRWTSSWKRGGSGRPKRKSPNRRLGKGLACSKSGKGGVHWGALTGKRGGHIGTFREKASGGTLRRREHEDAPLIGETARRGGTGTHTSSLWGGGNYVGLRGLKKSEGERGENQKKKPTHARKKKRKFPRCNRGRGGY